MYDPVLSREEVVSYLEEVFPETRRMGFAVDLVESARLRMTLPENPRHLRPGGTISGPTMMMLADTAAYLVVLAHIGRQALAVTTSLQIDFLRKPVPGDLVASAELLKLGSRLAVSGVRIYSGAGGAEPALDNLVASASVTYSIPPR